MMIEGKIGAPVNLLLGKTLVDYSKQLKRAG